VRKTQTHSDANTQTFKNMQNTHTTSPVVNKSVLPPAHSLLTVCNCTLCLCTLQSFLYVRVCVCVCVSPSVCFRWQRVHFIPNAPVSLLSRTRSDQVLAAKLKQHKTKCALLQTYTGMEETYTIYGVTAEVRRRESCL